MREGVRAIAEGMRYVRPRGKTGLKLNDDDDSLVPQSKRLPDYRQMFSLKSF